MATLCPDFTGKYRPVFPKPTPGTPLRILILQNSEIYGICHPVSNIKSPDDNLFIITHKSLTFCLRGLCQSHFLYNTVVPWNSFTILIHVMLIYGITVTKILK